MPVIIDGNNLLYAARAASDTALLLGRAMLCGALGTWARRQSEQVTVVFDGPAPPDPLASQIGHPGIRTAYSGAGVSADAVVIQMIAEHSAPRRLTVVSSDRVIARAARRRRARPVGSEEFWARVQRDLAYRPPPTEPVEKERGQDSEATRAWLEEFGLDSPPDDPPGGLTGPAAAGQGKE